MAGGRLLYYVPALLVIYLVFHFGSATFEGIPFLTRDPAYTTKTSPWLGVVSNLGLLLWAATAAICFFASSTGERRYAGLLRAAGGLTTLLLVDDMLQLHEGFFWRFDWLFYLLYGVLLFLLIAVYWNSVVASSYGHLLMAGVCFAASIMTDVVRLEGDLAVLFEDGAKLLGQTAWLIYFVGLAAEARPARAGSETAPSGFEAESALEELLEFLSQKFNEGKPVTAETQLIDNLFHDSLGLLEIVMFLEQRFEVTFEASEPERFTTAAAIIELVQQKQ